MDGTETKHESFAQISLHRIQGQRDLYGVDFPQGHFMELRISRSSHNRSLSNDWFHEGELIINVAMAETQWAQLLCSPNTTGVPCTLANTNFPGEGYRTIEGLKHDTGAQGSLHIQEFKATVKDATEAISSARSALESLLSKPSIGKAALREILGLIERAEREAVANLPFVVEQAGESIEKAKTSAMGEVAAYVGVTLQQMGSDALREQLSKGLLTNGKHEQSVPLISTATAQTTATPLAERQNP